jgi:hypothetical protein
MLTTNRLRLFATVGVAIGLLGGTATGIFLVTAADPPKSNQTQTVKNQDATIPAVVYEKTTALVANAEPSVDSGPLTKPLKKLKLDPNNATAMAELLALIEDETDLVVRIDIAAFRRIGFFEADEERVDQFMQYLSQRIVTLPRRVDKLPIRDVLTDALAQINASERGSRLNLTYQLRGSQLAIIPAYSPAYLPTVNPLDLSKDESLEMSSVIEFKMILQQIYGGAVSIKANNQSLPTILADLQKQTGANILIDPRCTLVKRDLSVNLNDVRLYDALRVIADMAELKLVYAGNIYYVTTAENAKTFYPPTTPLPKISVSPTASIPPAAVNNPKQP